MVRQGREVNITSEWTRKTFLRVPTSLSKHRSKWLYSVVNMMAINSLIKLVECRYKLQSLYIIIWSLGPGNENYAVVEYAPYQKIPGEKKKLDTRHATIEKGIQPCKSRNLPWSSPVDEDYISFIKSLNTTSATEPLSLETLSGLSLSPLPLCFFDETLMMSLSRFYSTFFPSQDDASSWSAQSGEGRSTRCKRYYPKSSPLQGYIDRPKSSGQLFEKNNSGGSRYSEEDEERTGCHTVVF